MVSAITTATSSEGPASPTGANSQLVLKQTQIMRHCSAGIIRDLRAILAGWRARAGPATFQLAHVNNYIRSRVVEVTLLTVRSSPTIPNSVGGNWAEWQQFFAA